MPMVASSLVRIVLIGNPSALSSEVRSAVHSTNFELAVVERIEDLEHQIAQHQPHLLLLAGDLSLCAVVAIIGRFRGRWPVLLLASDVASSRVVRALRAGAAGYLLRGSLQQELPLALHTVLDGHRYLSPRVSGPLLDLAVGATEVDQDRLTLRQKEVLYWLAQGNCTKEIAYLMNLSIKTVNAHKIRLKERLGIHDLAGLVVYALRHGIIDLPS